jgi:hypothetical protein
MALSSLRIGYILNNSSYMELTGHSPPITYSTSSTTATTEGGPQQKGEVRTWLDGFSSPLIQDEGDSKLLKLRFDVSQYQPEEIVVKTVDNKLLVSPGTGDGIGHCTT